jgi:UDPglucose 6-dehydrogenase
MKLAVVGSGYVGLVAGACLAELGHDVLLVDNDSEKMDMLLRGEMPIHEQFLPELISRNRLEGRLQFSDSIANAVQSSSVIFIAVGTPALVNGAPDLSYVEAVASAVAKHVGDFKVIVEKSTVPVLTHQEIGKVMMLNGAPPESFEVASNPEFLREGTAVADFLFPDRIVIGADGERGAAVLRKVYEPLTSGTYYSQMNALPRPARFSGNARLLVTSAKSAELIKHASNSFLAMKISFINAIANICEAVGADVEEVCQGIGSDSRIGERFLRPGIGYGGSCFPKDLMAFKLVAEECGLEFGLLDEVIKLNEYQRCRFVRKVRSALWNLRGKKIAALGLAFKGGTDDIRESPALAVITALCNEGAEVVVYDPQAMERTKSVLQDKVKYATSVYDACAGAHAMVVLTDWKEFAELDLALVRRALRHPIVIDGRNLFRPEQMLAAGLHYYSVGRPTALPATASQADAQATVQEMMKQIRSVEALTDLPA